jgi:fatty-acyl-CoA synthase
VSSSVVARHGCDRRHRTANPKRPKAFVTLREGAHADERDIIDFCRQNLAHFKAPVAVEFGPLPKTSTGKVRKNILRERERAGRSSKVSTG